MIAFQDPADDLLRFVFRPSEADVLAVGLIDLAHEAPGGRLVLHPDREFPDGLLAVVRKAAGFDLGGREGERERLRLDWGHLLAALARTLGYPARPFAGSFEVTKPGVGDLRVRVRVESDRGLVIEVLSVRPPAVEDPGGCLAFAEDLAREASCILLDHAGGDYARKGPRDLVTAADTASERLIVERIRAAFPDHAILGEEGGRREGAGAWEWIVDPLDGTTNYAHGLAVYSVAIGLARLVDGRRRMELAVVHCPRLGETFTARRSGGAFLNGAPIRVSGTAALGDALLATGFAYDRDRTPDHNLANWSNLVLRARDLRRWGAASIDLAYVACGRFDGFWELHLSPWDKGPGALLVEEAGGRVTDQAGGEAWLEGPSIVATNGRLHETLRASLVPLRDGAWPA